MKRIEPEETSSRVWARIFGLWVLGEKTKEAWLHRRSYGLRGTVEGILRKWVEAGYLVRETDGDGSGGWVYTPAAVPPEIPLAELVSTIRWALSNSPMPQRPQVGEGVVKPAVPVSTPKMASEDRSTSAGRVPLPPLPPRVF